ncbi:AMP-binding protein [Sphingomonas sp. MG17]|uniref:AMP-binding protein n=1 Tax=Sphingomonas tagetis TaxID=2949092 RepID=A0A9X2KN28_9SPHN|nr:AMP-binding protein [Sphingomonas tagetis]MCP3732101.1 AMP-binding protein [Sphingomonas tagetis]
MLCQHDSPIDPKSGALSIGIVMRNTEAKVVGDDGEELPHRETGELVMRRPQICVGYWRKPEETAATLRDGWMHSGDVAFQDENG